MAPNHILRAGWEEEADGIRYIPVRGKEGTVKRRKHPTTFRVLFHAVAWSRLSLTPLVDMWTMDRREAMTAVEVGLK